MSFFPIQIIITESTGILWITDSHLSVIRPPSEEAFLQNLAELLAKIESAAHHNLSFISHSINFTASPTYMRLLSSCQNFPEAVKKAQYLLILVHYIQNWASHIAPGLFSSFTSLGTQMCLHTIWTLQQFIQRNTAPLTERATTSTAIQTWMPSLSFNELQRFGDTRLTRQPIGSPIPAAPLLTKPEGSRGKKRHLTESHSLDDSDNESIDVVSLPIDSQEPFAKKQKTFPTSLQKASETSRSPLPPMPLKSQISVVGTLPSPSRLEASSLEASDEEEVETITPLPTVPVMPIIPRPAITAARSRSPSPDITTPIATTSATVTPGRSFQLREYVSIKAAPNTMHFQITGFKEIPHPQIMKVFLKTVLEAANRSSYVCAVPIPEIPQSSSNNKLDLLRVLYGAVLRNDYFFKLNHPHLAPLVKVSIQNTLSKLNKSYCTHLNLPYNDLLHHADLTVLAVSSPKKFLIPCTISWIITYMRPNHFHDLVIQTNFYIEDDPYFNLNKIKENLTNSLKNFKHLRTKRYCCIKCYDKTIFFTHYQKKLLTKNAAVENLKKIIETNKSNYRTYNSNIPDDHRTETINILNQKIQQLFIEVETVLEEWVTTDFIDEDDDENTALSQSFLQQIEDENSSPLQKHFYLLDNSSSFHRTFVIRKSPTKRHPSFRQFLNFLNQVEISLSKTAYISENYVPEITVANSQEPTNILKTLFIITCKNAFLFQKSNNTHSLPPETTSSLITLLKNIDKRYCKQTHSPYNSSSSIFHPDLQPFIDTYKILFFLQTQPALFTFPYCHIDISVSGSKKIVRLSKKLHSTSYPSIFLSILEKNMKYICTSLIRITHLPQNDHFHVMATDLPQNLPIIHTGTKISRDTILRDCLAILTQIYENLKQLPFADRLTPLVSFSTLNNYLNFTLPYLTSFLETGIVPNTLIPNDLQPHIHLFLQSIHAKNHFFVIKQNEIFCQLEAKNAKSIENNIEMSRKALCQRFTDPFSLVSHHGHYEKIRTGDVVPLKDSLSIISFIYRGFEQNLLQIQQLLKKRLTNPHLPFDTTHITKAITITREILTMLKHTWEALYPGQKMPSLNDLSSELCEELHLNADQVHAIRRELRDFASLLEEEHIAYSSFIFSINDFDDAEPISPINSENDS